MASQVQLQMIFAVGTYNFISFQNEINSRLISTEGALLYPHPVVRAQINRLKTRAMLQINTVEKTSHRVNLQVILPQVRQVYQK